MHSSPGHMASQGIWSCLLCPLPLNTITLQSSLFKETLSHSDTTIPEGQHQQMVGFGLHRQ